MAYSWKAHALNIALLWSISAH